MQLIKVINARQIINSFIDKEDIDSTLAYWMVKFMIKTENEHVFYASEAQKLLDKYAETTDGDMKQIPAAKIAEFNEAIERLNAVEVEDPGIRFTLSLLSSELKLSMKQMYCLLDFVDENA